MSIASRIKTKYLSRLEELVAEGEAMPMEQRTRQTAYSSVSREARYQTYEVANWPKFVEWRTSCIAVLDQIVAPSSLLRKTLESFGALANEPDKVKFGVGFLRSVKRELEAGSLDSLTLQIEAEVQSDYLTQAASILTGSNDEHAHVAAAVIAGASLERCLRTLCKSLEPEEPIENEKGAPFGMSALVDALKRRQVFNELQAKELRTWATLRNHAAHGQFGEFSREQVFGMVRGVTRFVTEYSA